ncbi:MAG: hypothetical protein PVG65_00940 [Candidatus Thorarchaeota archaeon]|jgi:hypothetical protein
MTIEKWVLVGGQIYRLSEVFKKGRDAILHARLIKEYRSVFVSRTDNGRWAVYWKAKRKDLTKTIPSCNTV